jgi:hypothetical protein
MVCSTEWTRETDTSKGILTQIDTSSGLRSERDDSTEQYNSSSLILYTYITYNNVEPTSYTRWAKYLLSIRNNDTRRYRYSVLETRSTRTIRLEVKPPFLQPPLEPPISHVGGNRRYRGSIRSRTRSYCQSEEPCPIRIHVGAAICSIGRDEVTST